MQDYTKLLRPQSYNAVFNDNLYKSTMCQGYAYILSFVVCFLIKSVNNPNSTEGCNCKW